VTGACPFSAAGTVLNRTQFGLCVLSKNSRTRRSPPGANSASSCKNLLPDSIDYQRFGRGHRQQSTGGEPDELSKRPFTLRPKAVLGPVVG
jgi:hypothetical protein